MRQASAETSDTPVSYREGANLAAPNLGEGSGLSRGTGSAHWRGSDSGRDRHWRVEGPPWPVEDEVDAVLPWPPSDSWLT